MACSMHPAWQENVRAKCTHMACPTGRVNEGEGADSASVCMSCAAELRECGTDPLPTLSHGLLQPFPRAIGCGQSMPAV